MRTARLITAVLVALAVIAVPEAARAEAGPEIQYATSEFEGNTGVLLVGVRSADGVSAVQADVKNHAGEVIASSNSFWRYRDEGENSVWATDEPFILPQLGDYPVDVSVTDDNGVTTTEKNVGVLSYVVVTYLDSVTVKPATATYEKRTVTVTGVLKGRFPGTREVRRVPGVRIDLLNTSWQNTTTGADGKFTAEVPITENGQRIHIDFVYDPTLPYHLASYFDTAEAMIKPRATKVTSSVTAKRVKAGESITVSGTASWNTPDGWTPVGTGKVNVSACNIVDTCNSYGLVPVAADGTYTLTVTPSESATLRSYYVPAYRADGYVDPYVTTSQRDVPIFVLQVSEIPRFTASRESGGAVHLDGSVEFPAGNPPGNIPVEFQFSETGTGDWLTIGDDEQSPWDGEGGYEFEGRLTEPRSGWWRARYAGDPAGFQASTSKKIYVP